MRFLTPWESGLPTGAEPRTSKGRIVKLVRYIANLGYGSRREVTNMLREGQVKLRDGSIVKEGDFPNHEELLIDGKPLDPAPGALIMLNKPAGYVCSAQEASTLIYDLMPPRFHGRSPAMSPAGRLDRDTSGLLLLTDDGQLNHRITSPRNHLPRVYDVRLSQNLRGDEAATFASGAIVLESDRTPLKPATLEILDTRHVRITLTEGRYHQVRRMFAAVGNHVEALHRFAIGGLQLGPLSEGSWRVVELRERIQLLGF